MLGDVAIPLLAALLAFTLGVITSRQNRHAGLAQERLRRYEAFLKAVRDYQDAMEPWKHLHWGTPKPELPERASTLPIERAHEDLRLISPLEVNAEASRIVMLVVSEVDEAAGRYDSLPPSGDEFPKSMSYRLGTLDNARRTFVEACSDDLRPPLSWTILGRRIRNAVRRRF
jgi:hypothetical protein